MFIVTDKAKTRRGGGKRCYLLILLCYESRKREPKTRPIYECRCDERLKTIAEKSLLFIMNRESEISSVNLYFIYLFIMNQKSES